MTGYRLMLTTLALLACSASAFGQGLSGETEVAVDTGRSFSQYIFYDAPKMNIVTRYFIVKDGVNRGEFAAGPTFKWKSLAFKPAVGGTTDKDVMLAHTLVTSIYKRLVVYIADAKLGSGENPNTLYQKVIVALNERGNITFRAEHLQVNDFQAFLRIGGEYQLGLPRKTQVFISPFYDTINDSPGFFTGFRFF
jgi:hypothetical protein